MQLSVCLSHTVKEETTEMMTHDDPSYENGTIVTMVETGMLEGPKSAGVRNYLCKVGKVFD